MLRGGYEDLDLTLGSDEMLVRLEEELGDCRHIRELNYQLLRILTVWLSHPAFILEIRLITT